MRLKCAVCKSTLSTADAVPLPQWGRLRYEDVAFLALSKRIYVYVKKNNIDGQSLPRVGNAVKLSKILIAHASNSVCFFHFLSLLVNNKIKKLVK